MRTRETTIEVVGATAEPLSAEEELYYGVVEGWMSASLSIPREYCKFMITTAFAAVPVYLGLLRFAVTATDASLTSNPTLALVVTPPFFLLASAIAFISGYFPRKTEVDLASPTRLKAAYGAAIKSRRLQIFAGTGFFFLGVGIATIAVLRLLLYS